MILSVLSQIISPWTRPQGAANPGTGLPSLPTTPPGQIPGFPQSGFPTQQPGFPAQQPTPVPEPTLPVDQAKTYSKQLLDMLKTVQPGSPESQMIQGQLQQISPSLPPIDQLETQAQLTAFALKDIDAVSKQLAEAAQGVNPNSPESQALVSRVMALEGVKKNLTAQGAKFGKQIELLKRQDSILAKLPQTPQGQIAKQAFVQLQSMAPESPQAQALQGQIEQFAQGQPAPMGDVVQGAFIVQAQRQLENMRGALAGMTTGATPGSPEFGLLNQRTTNINLLYERLEANLKAVLTKIGVT